jgi:hypothetical protein
MSAATLLQYPDVSVIPGIDIKVIWRPKNLNFDPQQHTSGREVIVQAASLPLHEFEIIYNMLRGIGTYPTTPELQTLMAFYLQNGGALTPFQYKNPYDYIVLGQTVSPFMGSTTSYLLTRTFGAGGYASTEPIGFVDVSLAAPILNGHANFNVYFNGVLQSSSAYTIDYSTFSGTNLTGGGAGQVLLNFGSAPSGPVTVDMSYLYFCRFGDDSLDFEELLWNLFTIKKVLIVSKRGPAPS